MIYELNIIPALIVSLLVIVAFYFSYKRERNTRVNIITGLLVVQVFLQISYPALYGYWEDYPWESHYGVSPADLFIVYNIELLSVGCWIIGFNSCRAVGKGLCLKIIPALSEKNASRLLILIVLVMVYCMTVIISQGLPAFGRMEEYDASSIAADVMLWPFNLPVPFSLWNLLLNTFYLPGILAAGILATARWSPEAKKIHFIFGKTIGSIVLLLMFFWGMITSLRQFIMAVVFMTLIFGLAQNNKKVLRYSIAGLLILMLLAPLMQSGYRDALMETEARDIGVTERLLVLFQMERSQDSQNSLVRIWRASGERFSDALMATGLIKATLRGDSAGIMPLLSALLSPIPRFIWRDKPAPGSSDGTNAGVAVFVVWKELIGREWGLSGFFTSGAHAFWELNIPGVILYGLFAGIFARAMLRLTESSGQLGLLVWGLSMNANAFIVNLWAPQIFIILFQRILPVLLIAWIWSVITRLRL